MWPTVSPGDVLLVDQGCHVSPADLVVVRVGGQLIAHRCVEMHGGSLRCANARGELDPWVHVSHVFGRVVFIERGDALAEVPRSDRFAGMISRARSLASRALAAAPTLRTLLRRTWRLA